MTKTDGVGVILCACIIVKSSGICPLQAPAQNSLDEVNKIPLTAPNVDKATKTGIVQASGPNNLSAKETATASDPRSSDGDKVV